MRMWLSVTFFLFLSASHYEFHEITNYTKHPLFLGHSIPDCVFNSSVHRIGLRIIRKYRRRILGDNGMVIGRSYHLMVSAVNSLLFLPHFKLSQQKQAKVELSLVAVSLYFVFISATIYKISMGYSVIILMATLTALATLSLSAKLKIMQGDKFILALTYQHNIIDLFLYCLSNNCYFVSMFYDGDMFSPKQVCTYLIRITLFALSQILLHFPVLSVWFPLFSV